MGISYTQSTDTSTDMGLKDYSKSRMRENCKYGSVRGVEIPHETENVYQVS